MAKHQKTRENQQIQIKLQICKEIKKKYGIFNKSKKICKLAKKLKKILHSKQSKKKLQTCKQTQKKNMFEGFGSPYLPTLMMHKKCICMCVYFLPYI